MTALGSEACISPLLPRLPSPVLTDLSDVLAEDKDRPIRMRDRLAQLFKTDTTVMSEGDRAHVDMLIFSYYALMKEVRGPHVYPCTSVPRAPPLSMPRGD